MQRPSPPDGLEFPQPQSQVQHSPTLSADRISMSPPSSSPASPPSVAPDPVYIAASAASQIVTSDHQSQIDDWFHENGGKMDAETAVVAPASLILVNAFLDQLLFSILACARSTSIISLRPAVAEVLKPRLAKDAIDGADEELREFLGVGDDEELSVFHNGQESRGKWDLNLVWRRTRLRCMVYTRLGDLEEEDEELYIEQERMEEAAEDHRRLSRELGIISPAAAIFLTSILEFIGEHALMVAGEAAFNRREIRQLRNNSTDPSAHTDGTTRVVVEDVDVEKLAFNTTLGRLWRSWKKRVRAPSISSSRPVSRDIMRKRAASLSASPSVSEMDESFHDSDHVPRSSLAQVLQEEQEPNLSDTSLNSDDLVIGLAKTTLSHIPGMNESNVTRPRSMMLYSQPLDVLPVTTLPGTNSPNGEESVHPEYVRSRWHQRSASLPTPECGPYVSPPYETFFTPMESPGILSRMPGQSQDQESHPIHGEDLSTIPHNDAAREISSTHRDNENDSEPHIKEADRSEECAADLVESSSLLVSSKEPTESAQDLPHAMSTGWDAKAEDLLLSVPKENRKPRHGNDTITTQGNEEDDVQYPPPIYRKPRAKVSGQVQETPLDSLDNPVPVGLATMQGQQLRDNEYQPEHQSSNLEKRKAAVGYEDASNHSGPGSNQSIFPRKYLPLRENPTEPTGPSSGLEHGAPPLTPLRELVEAAQDTSDDSSSIAPSHDAPKSEVVVRTEPLNEPPSPGSFNSSNISPTKHSLRANQASDLPKELPLENTVGTERAAVQRITPPSPVLARDPLGPMVRTSTSSNRPHTSASGTSQFSHKIKALIGRDSMEGNRQPTLTRSSSDDSGTASDGQSAKPPIVLNKQRSFEELMKSDETIQYTLTPKNMRDMEKTDSSRNVSSQPETREVPDIHRTGEPPDPESSRSTTGRAIVALKGLNGLRSNPPVKLQGSGSTSSRSPSSLEKEQRTSSTSLTSRSSPAIPRDATGKKETTADFAAFIRSTGPDTEREPLEGNVKPIPGWVSRSKKPGYVNSRISSAPERSNSARITRELSVNAPGATSKPPSKRFKPKLQAREATVSYNDQSSDLIDFIRQGPAPDRGDGHRIPRIVAPFRTTMDSDEIQDLGTGKAKETRDARSSVASTQDSIAAPKSIPSSLNSRTALIDNSNRSKSRNASAPVASNPARLDEPPHPTRKQRRNKDPYAVETESDEEGENAITPQPREHEENLIDFLRSLTPPPSNHTRPSAFDEVQKPSRNTLQKTSTGPSMRDRFPQKGGSPPFSKTSASRQIPRLGSNSSSARHNNEGPQLPPLSPRATSPHLVSQIGSKIDSFIPTSPTYASHVERERIDRERNGTRRRQQARMEREPNSGITELADFLKNSGPPTPPENHTPVGRSAKEESGFIKILSRKIKITGRA